LWQQPTQNAAPNQTMFVIFIALALPLLFELP